MPDDETLIRLAGGARMPALGIGTWQLTGSDCSFAVRKALELGYRHIDTADHYGNHADIASAIAGFNRKNLFITSKIWPDSLARRDVAPAVERFIRELRTDYLDLLLIHWPNPGIPIHETLGAMSELQESGIVKAIGVSNFSVSELEEAITAGARVSVNQIKLHVGIHEEELLDACMENKVAAVAYSPLARGSALRHRTIVSIAERRGKTPAQVCLRWALQKGAAVIPKASSEGHLRENMGVFGWKLGKAEMEGLDRIRTGNNKALKRVVTTYSRVKHLFQQRTL